MIFFFFLPIVLQKRVSLQLQKVRKASQSDHGGPYCRYIGIYSQNLYSTYVTASSFVLWLDASSGEVVDNAKE